MAPSSPSSPSQTHHTLNLEDGEDVLRSKRSSVTVEWSDGYKVIFVRPCRPRSGPYSGSQSRSASQSLSGLDLQNGRREDRAHSRLTSVHPQSSVQGSNSERERHNLTSGSGFAAERGATKLQDRRQSRMSLAVSSNGHQRSTTAPAPEEARFVFPLRERESEAWDAVYNISNEEQHRRGYRSQGQELGQQRCESKDPNMRISNALLQRSSSMFAEDGRNSPRVGQGENEGPNHPNQVQHMPSIQSHKQRRASTSPPFIAHSGSPCLNPPLSPLVTDPRRTMPIHPQPFYNDGSHHLGHRDRISYSPHASTSNRSFVDIREPRDRYRDQGQGHHGRQRDEQRKLHSRHHARSESGEGSGGSRHGREGERYYRKVDGRGRVGGREREEVDKESRRYRHDSNFAPRGWREWLPARWILRTAQ